jgi:hypothetical protein
MSVPLLAALVVFALGNVAEVVLLLVGSWRRLALFYLADVAVFIGIAAIVILRAPPGIDEGWTDHTESFGHELTLSQAVPLGWGMVWLITFGFAAIAIVILRSVAAVIRKLDPGPPWFPEQAMPRAKTKPDTSRLPG